MSLIVETGVGLPDSDSYASVTDANIYHANRGNPSWAAMASDELREQALRKATDYLTQAYRDRWKGYRSLTTQALDWPRQNVYVDESGFKTYRASNVTPVEVKNACCELALKSTTQELNPDIERQTASESIGSLSVTYVPGATQNTLFRAIDMMLKPLLKSGGSSIQINRA
jgi:hypothetical protein